MKLQREDIHPLQDTCPYFLSVVYRQHRLPLRFRLFKPASLRKLVSLRVSGLSTPKPKSYSS